MKNRDISFEYPKNPYLNQATQNNACQTFPTPKNPEIEISNPRKSFHHPFYLTSGGPPAG